MAFLKVVRLRVHVTCFCSSSFWELYSLAHACGIADTIHTCVVKESIGEALAVDGAIALDLDWRTATCHRHCQ